MPPAPNKYGLNSAAGNAFFWFIPTACIPALYVWSLPILSERQTIPLQVGYPSDDRVKQSISFYISTPSGTGCMAFVYMLPVVAMWSEEARRSVFLHKSRTLRLTYFLSLLAFHIFFGLFLFFTGLQPSGAVLECQTLC